MIDSASDGDTIAFAAGRYDQILQSTKTLLLPGKLLEWQSARTGQILGES